MAIEWKERRGGWGPVSYVGYSGEVRVFSIHLSMTRGEDHLLVSALPGLVDQTLATGNVETLKQVAEQTFSRWLLRAGLKKTEEIPS